MNKKQLIVAWVTGLIICFVIIRGGFSWWETSDQWGWYFDKQTEIRIIATATILGGLLILTLRGRKKSGEGNKDTE